MLKKYLHYDQFNKMGDRVIPTRYKMQTVKKKDRFTLMDIIAAKFDLSIPDKIFTLQNLKSR